LKHGNEISLSQRLRRIVEPFKDLLGNKKQRSKFEYKTSITRNYLTHYLKDLEEDASDGEQLIRITDKLQAIFQLHLLYVIGFSVDEIKRMASNNHLLKRKLELTI